MTPETYPHNMRPFEHQAHHIANHWSDKAWGLLWEQGTAKTKPIIDTAVLQYTNGMIDGLLVVAPPGVERNWRSDEIPEHLPADLSLETRVTLFQTKRKGTKTHKARMEAAVRHSGLSVLLISYNASQTKEGKTLIRKFLDNRKVLMVLDEAHNIKSPGAKRTKNLVAQGRYAVTKRILTGTPISVGPFDLYSQVRFLDEYFWKNHGIHGYVEFKQYFGEWITRAMCQQMNGYDPGYDQLIEYCNLDKLEEWLASITDRYLKDDVLDLPPKLYSKRYFDMSREQWDAYNTLKETMMLEIGDDLITAELPIVRLLRFQQIASGYLPSGVEEGRFHMLGDKNPRLAAMEELKSEIHHPCIIWGRFRQDVDQLMDLFGDGAVRYDGTVDEDQAERNKKAFQSGDAQWFIGTAAKGGPGLTLTQAKTMIYYNNSFKLIDRLQSEDRCHRAGMDEHPVNYIDVCANDVGIDVNVVANLRNKRDISQQILGDEWREWI